MRNVMASDAPDGWYNKPQGLLVLDRTGRRSPSSTGSTWPWRRDAERISMAPAETFWAERFAMFTDKYGTPWMLNFTGNKMQPA